MELEKGKNFDLQLLKTARQTTIRVVEDFFRGLEPGISELEAAKELQTRFAEAGAKKFWHKCIVRFGSNTTHGFKEDLDPQSVLQARDIVTIDAGPVFNGHEADYGKTFVKGHGQHFERIRDDVEAVFNYARDLWQRTGCSGAELYKQAETRALSLGWEMAPDYVVGHRLGAFPHLLYDKRTLPSLDRTPEPYLWILEIQLQDPEGRCGAFFEDWLA